MVSRLHWIALVLCLVGFGCQPPATEQTDGNGANVELGEPSGNAGTGAGEEGAAAVTVENGEVAIGPGNTTIQFVGVHADPEKPDPRTGVFTDFAGKLSVVDESNALSGVEVVIQTASLATGIEELNNHLQGPDFFEVNAHPEAKFVSTDVSAGEGEGQFTVTGDLTLHGETQEISFPATFTVADSEAKLQSEFTLDRTQFDINYGPDQILPEVQMTITVGQATEVPAG